MDYKLLSNKYLIKLNVFTGGRITRYPGKRNLLGAPPKYSRIVDSWVKYEDAGDIWYVNSKTNESVWVLPPNSWIKNDIYTNSNREVRNNPPNKNVWIKIDDESNTWYKNIYTNISELLLPPDSWLKSIIYTNSTTGDSWEEVRDSEGIWFTNTKTNEPSWFLPSPKIINTLVYEDLEIYDNQGAGESNDIWPIITKYYIINNNKLSFIGIKNNKNLFSIIPHHINDKTEPILGKGTFTAVYVIKDVNTMINDDTDTYILRIYTRDSSYTENNMFDYQKVKDEFLLFKKYMATIYLYGSIYKGKYPMYKNGQFDYNITKVYKTLSDSSIEKLTNKQKVQFLLENLKMLHILSTNNYIHCDYKIDNVAYDDPEKMNVVLIDYDITTLQPLVQSNTNFVFDANNNVNTLYTSSTYPPMYISGELPLEYPINVTYKIPLKQWDKYSIGGLIDIIVSLNISYRFDTIIIDQTLTNGKITKLNSRDMIHSLKLNDKSYYAIPTYEEILNIYFYLIESKYL